MKLITANKLSRFWNGIKAILVLKTKVLTTKEQIAANTNAENVASAVVVKEIYNKLSQVRTYVGTDGKLHSVDGTGADTVLNFSSVITGEATFNGNEMPLFTVSNIPSEPKMVFWYTKNDLNRKGIFVNFKNISSSLVGLFFQLATGTTSFYNSTTYMRYDSALKTVTLASPSGYSVNQKVGYAIVI